MRVLISAESFLPRSNGVTNSVIQVLKYLRDRGNDVLILAAGNGPTIVEGFPVIRFSAISVNSIAQVDIPTISLRRLEKIIREFNPDIAHLASPFFLGERVGKVTKELGIPTVAIYQTDVTGFSNFYGLSTMNSLSETLVKKIHKRVDLTLAPSSHSIDYLKELKIEGIAKWGRGVDVEQFNPNRRSQTLRKSWGAKADTVVIGYVGRLAPEKQISKLNYLDQLGNITATKVKLVIIGDGPSRDKLGELLPDAHFTGILKGDDLGAAMASLDILISTGENETFCQVVQEAMAAGVPVVAPGIGGPVDLVQHGQTGYLYNPGSISSMRECVLLLLANKELRNKFAKNAHIMVQNRTWSNLVAQLVDYYQSLRVSKQESVVA